MGLGTLAGSHSIKSAVYPLLGLLEFGFAFCFVLINAQGLYNNPINSTEFHSFLHPLHTCQHNGMFL